MSDAATSSFRDVIQRTVTDNHAFIVRGPTGSGKTWFVSKLAECIGTSIVLVPQHPLFKPQLHDTPARVDTFINMLPLHSSARKKLLNALAIMNVPSHKRIGGKLMGMLDIGGLSGGQRKKLLLALAVQLALARKAKAIILDEPFAGIDVKSMPLVLKVLCEIEALRETKIFLVTHDHFELINDAFSGTPQLHIDARQLRVDRTSAMHTTVVAAHVIAKIISELPDVLRRPLLPHVDWYLVKRHFIEGEHVLPTFTMIVFGVLSGMATANFKGGGEGIVPFSSIYAFFKVFMLEYIHFGSLLNYCFKRGQHIEDFNLMLTRKRDAIVETIIIAVIQSVLLSFLLNGILIGISSRFWWVNNQILFVDALYALLAQLAYTLLPVIQPNPLITMASVFPYVAVWGFYAGYLLPRDMALKNTRWLTLFSPTYHFACANAKASSGHIRLPRSNCKAIGIHLSLMSPLLIFILCCLLYIRIRNCLRIKANTQRMKSFDDAYSHISISNSDPAPEDTKRNSRATVDDDAT